MGLDGPALLSSLLGTVSLVTDGSVPEVGAVPGQSVGVSDVVSELAGAVGVSDLAVSELAGAGARSLN